MDILSDAEYSRLTPIEKAQYWHARFQDLEAAYELMREDNWRLRRGLGEVYNIVDRLTKGP